MPRIEISQLAQDDLDEIWVYFSQVDREIGIEFMARLQMKLKLLAKNVNIGRRVNHLILDLRKFKFEHYLVFYFPIENGIEIHRIIHRSRDIAGQFEDYFENL